MLQIIANLGTAGDGRRGAGCFFGLLAQARGRRRNAMRTLKTRLSPRKKQPAPSRFRMQAAFSARAPVFTL
ncbi:hypothetical protein [Kingella denitrificans]|uniref:hypothetical protein n=1 Tax=Kingella denitrificans TaxID=502 RepID=UPI0011D05D7C|nr:hypothetical protein [Kingella denitrificans]